MSHELSTSELLVPANFLHRSRQTPDTAGPRLSPSVSASRLSAITGRLSPTGATLSPTGGGRQPSVTGGASPTGAARTSAHTTPGRASALGRMEKAVAELMAKLQQLTETVMQLEAAMRQLVRNAVIMSSGSHYRRAGLSAARQTITTIMQPHSVGESTSSF